MLLSFANYIYNLNYRMVVPVMPVVNHDLSNTLLKNTLNTECITLSMLNCKLNLSKDFVSLKVRSRNFLPESGVLCPGN